MTDNAAKDSRPTSDERRAATLEVERQFGSLAMSQMHGTGSMAVMRAVHHGCEKYHEWYLRDSLWLAGAIERARVDTANNTCNGAIVLTHHAPLTKPEVVHSSSREMRGHIYGCEGTNNLYASMVAFDNPCVRAWAYGHTHKCFSMRCERSGLLLLSNPAGHWEGEVEGNFCPRCVLVVDGGKATKECSWE